MTDIENAAIYDNRIDGAVVSLLIVPDPGYVIAYRQDGDEMLVSGGVVLPVNQKDKINRFYAVKEEEK